MQRRNFLGLSVVLGSGLLLSAQDMAVGKSEQQKPSGAITLYYEFRIAKPEKSVLFSNIEALIAMLKEKTGYLSLSFKQMSGESTMVKNYPNHLKGVLDRGLADANGNPTSNKIPLFYSLFIRFESYEAMIKSDVQKWFKNSVAPSFFAYKPTNPPTKTALSIDYYEGIYITVAAGDRTKIYTTPEEIKSFLKNQSDEISNRYVTVENHVSIHDGNTDPFNKKVAALLTTAQQTFRPDASDPDYNGEFPNGQAGSPDNTYYRKAVTTEILQNAFTDGVYRSYIMHGVWESMYDHENSHIDPRFLASASPVGAFVISGPVEPFYDTIKQG